jgi:hypothetical protein
MKQGIFLFCFRISRRPYVCPVLLFHTGGHSRESQIKADAVVNNSSCDSVGRDTENGFRISIFECNLYHVSFSFSVLRQNF